MLVYLLACLLTCTYTVGSVRIPAISPIRLKTEKITINGLYKVVHGLLIAAKMYDLELPLSEIQGH